MDSTGALYLFLIRKIGMKYFKNKSFYLLPRDWVKSILVGVFMFLGSLNSFSQIKFKNTLQADGQTYVLSLVSSTSYTGINSLISSSQVTVVVPHGEGANYFEFQGPLSKVNNMKWTFAGRIDAPVEDPDKDYLFFNFINNNSPIVKFDMPAKTEIPIFSIKRTSKCIGKVYVFDNENDPFVSPNSKGVNAGNNISVLGAGGEAYIGNTDPLLTVVFDTPNYEICAGEEVVFRVSPSIPGNYEYQWFVDDKPQGPASSSVEFRYKTEETESDFLRKVSVKIITNVNDICNSCTTRKHTELIVNGKPKAEILYSGYSCMVLPTDLKINGISGGNITWIQDGNELVNQNNTSFTVNQSGTYGVKVSRNGCTSTSAALKIIGVDGAQNLTVFAGNDTTITAGEQILLNGKANGVANFEWSPELLVTDPFSAQTRTSPEETTEYTLTATSDDGCPVTDKIKITVLHGLYIPSGFSPNSDGINDKWEIKNLEIYPENSIEVYNRWGRLVYAAKNTISFWDGYSGNAAIESGSYSYLVKTKNKVYRGVLEVLK